MLFASIVGGAIFVLTFAIVAIAVAPTKEEKLQYRRFSEVVADSQHHPGAEVEAAVIQERRTQWLRTVEKMLNRYYFYQHIEHLILQADIETTASFILVSSCVGFFCVLAASYVLLLPWPIALLSALPVGAAPLTYVLFRRYRRLKAFDKGLGEAIGILSRCLQSGLSIGAALEILSEQAPVPVNHEFYVVHQQILMGGDFRNCMMDMLKRIPSPDLRFLITALLIQRDTGGNLIEILEKAQQLIRDRIKLKGDLDAKTAQGRLTGVILMLLPFILAGFMVATSPGYLTPLLATALGHKAIYGAIVMECIGGAIMYRLVQVEI